MSSAPVLIGTLRVRKFKTVGCANNVDPDQTPYSAASVQGLHYSSKACLSEY